MFLISPVLFLILTALGIWTIRSHRMANFLALCTAVIVFGYFILYHFGLVDRGVLFYAERVFVLGSSFLTFSEPFALLFAFILVPIMIYNLQSKSNLSQAMTLVYAAASIACVTTDSLMIFFIGWETAAIASMFLVASGDNQFRSELVYFLFHFTSGLFLLAAMIVYYQTSGNFNFPHYETLDTVAAKLFFVAFGIKVGFPLLNLWLFIAYPNAHPHASVPLSVFSTKIAIYAMIIVFHGLSDLIWIGLLIAVLHTILASLCVHYRAMLTHALNAQLGVMLCMIGIGTRVSIDAAILLVVGHVLYKTYAFILAGSMSLVTGSNSFCAKAHFGLRRRWYLLLVIGGAILTAMPLTAIYVAKEYLHQAVTASIPYRFILVLSMINAWNFALVGLKPLFSYFVFSGRLAVMPPHHGRRDALSNTTITALFTIFAVSIFLGSYPAFLRSIIPAAREFPIFASAHVIKQLLTMISIIAFCWLLFYLRINPWGEHYLSHLRIQRWQVIRFLYVAPFIRSCEKTNRYCKHKLHFRLASFERWFVRRFEAFAEFLLVLSRLPSSYLAFWIIFTLTICLLTLDLAFL